MENPTVLFINRVYPPQKGATGRMLKDLAHGFAREGWNVKVIATGQTNEIQRDTSIRIYRTKGPERPKLITYPWLWLKLWWRARQAGKADLVISMTDPPLAVIAGRMIAKSKKAHHIHWCQDYYPGALQAMHLKPPGPIYKLLKKLSVNSLKTCDQIIAVGACMKDRLVIDGINHNKITVIPNWPDAALIIPSKKETQHFNHASSDISMKIGAKPHLLQMKTGPRFRVLYAGNIGRAHPIKTILEAAELLQESYPEIEFTFVGDGKRFNKLAEERDKRGLENIRFLPYQPENKLREIMESGDIHLISLAKAARGYMVPSKLYSALAVARPTVFLGPAKTETAETIRQYLAGQVVEPGNASALAEVIKNYRLDADLWFQAHNGAQNAKAHFLPDNAIKNWITQALTVIQGRQRNL